MFSNYTGETCGLMGEILRDQFPKGMMMSQNVQMQCKEPQVQNHQPGKSAFLSAENMTVLHQNKNDTLLTSCACTMFPNIFPLQG